MSGSIPPAVFPLEWSSVSGFGGAEYIHTLAEFGSPTRLPRSGGWYLRRRIPGTDEFDGLGSYPFFVCSDWRGLALDLEEAGRDLVSFSAIPEPFGSYDVDTLRKCFPDVCIHFKDHFIADLAQPADQYVTKHNRQRAEKALRQVQVEFCVDPYRHLDAWLTLFETAVRKFAITGVRAFSRESLALQLKVPGMVMSLARHQGEVVAIGLFCLENGVAYAHLVAANEVARKAGAFYALYWTGIDYFSGKARWIDWGGEAGVAPGGGGLGSFKQGWSSGTRPAYFCGRIFDPVRYEKIVQSKHLPPTRYFPAYRQGEFG